MEEISQIITSPMQTDAYKLNMQAVVLDKFSGDMARWAFRCRDNDVFFTKEMVEEINLQIDMFCGLSFTENERAWLSCKFPWLKPSYIGFLRYWRPCREHITVNEPWHVKYNDCGLTIEASGSWLDTMMYEIPILAIVNEVYFKHRYGKGTLDNYFKDITNEKIRRIERGSVDVGNFSEFGTRRRYSSEMQDFLVRTLCEKNVRGFVGTSNVYLAMKYGTKAVGTQAHEFFMAQQGHHEINPAYSNRFALQAWNDYYKTKLGIALTDTIGTDVFLLDFDENFATLFSGVRHDSGDPYEWGEKMISHYKKFGIDPKTKTLLFSDSLDLEKASNINARFRDRTNVAFGIGTDWTCPFRGYRADGDVKPLNIVMKTIEFNGSPVAKLSNTPGKIMSKDVDYIEYLRRCIDWRLKNDRG